MNNNPDSENVDQIISFIILCLHWFGLKAPTFFLFMKRGINPILFCCIYVYW